MKSNSEISIIICTYNREKILPVALNALTMQTLSPNLFEILIINNNSTDGTEEISKNFISTNPGLDIKYFVEKEKGLSAARNRGIKESSSPLVVFIDDDAEVAENYLETALDFFKSNHEISAIGGKIIPVYEDDKEPEWLSKNLWGLVTKVDYGEEVRNYPVSKYPPGCSMVFRKKVFETVGMFNTNLYLRSEDKYIFRQLEKYHKSFLYYPKLVLKHHIDNSRVTFESVKKISLIVGTSERVRLYDAGIGKNILKVLEYVLKFFASVVIAFGFLLKLEFKKAEYIVKNRWYTLIGYFVKSF
jgi:glucosyl-dolichyl phosphate glucuronosyltransferase